MRLVVICGQPAAGKSKVAQLLSEQFSARGLSVEVVDEESLHLIRDAAYADVVSEKNTRGSLRSAVDRALAGKVDVIILDSLNNIKGYRYELWCLARAAGAKYCMVHVDTPLDTCRAWNQSRPEQQRYCDSVFEDLGSRFERPDQRNRWDAPLFTIKPAADEDCEEAVGPGVAGVITSMCEEVATVQGVSVSKDLQPSLATSSTTLAATNTLHDMDQAVQGVINCVMDAQAAAAGGAAGLVRMPIQGADEPSSSASQTTVPILQLDQVVSLAELRRHKRAFVKLATKVTFSRLRDAEAARRMFVDYLIDNVQGCSRPVRQY